MTEQISTAEIDFQGRTMEVRLPDPGQMLVWRRTLTRLQGANLNDWNGAELMNALERLRKIIDSILVNDVDKDWIDDQLLSQVFGIQELAEIPTSAARAFHEQGNREERRAAKKAAPARRVAKKTTGGKK